MAAPDSQSPRTRTGSRVRPGLRALLEHLPLALFCLALGVLLLGLGMAIERYRLFPRSILRDAQTTAGATLDALGTGLPYAFRRFSDVPLDGIPARRIESVEGGTLSDAVLLSGGHYHSRELCPDHGCLAVAIAPSGEVVHAWPFRANAIQAANIADEDEYPYELNGFSAEWDLLVIGIEQYPNGDLLVVFQQDNSFPYGGGVARIGRDGRPRWFRRDYSHHWPRLVDGDTAFVPTYALGDGATPVGGRIFDHFCDGKHLRDALHVLDGDGTVLERIPVFEILLMTGSDILDGVSGCDPFHLNAVDVVGEHADGSGGILPGDLVLSFRNINAFAILDGATRTLKHLARGTFLLQHDVTHLAGTTFLLLDNQGMLANQGEGEGVSRLLMIDIATGVETTIYPNDRTPDSLRGLHTWLGGSIAISPDRMRALVAFEGRGRAIEVRLSDGEILSVIHSLHDVSALDQFPAERLDRAAILRIPTVEYLRGDAWPDP